MLGSRPIKPILPLNHPERDQPPAPAPQPQYPPQQPVYADEPEVPEFELPPLPPRPERRPLQPQISPQDDYQRAPSHVPPSHAQYAGYQEPAPAMPEPQPQPQYQSPSRPSRQPQYQPQPQPEPAPAPTYEYPSEPVEPRPYREPKHHAPRGSSRHSVFSTQFMRVMVILSVLMFGMLIGMKFSDYFHRRDFAAYQQEQELLNGTTNRKLAPVVPLKPLPPDPALLADNSNLPPIPPSASTPVPIPTPAPVAGLQPGFNPPSGTSGSSNISSELDAQRMEREMLNRRYQNLTNGTPGETGIGAPSSGGISPISPISGIPALPPAASSYTPGNSSIPSPPDANSMPLPPAAGDYPPLPSLAPGFNPSSVPKAPANLNASAQRVKDAQPIAKVKNFEADWGVVILNAGKANNLNVGHGLAIRRGHTVLGEIVLEEVYETESTAELSGAWKVDPKAPKPQAGDDVISWPLF